ncbi:unnamed protein product [Prunus brigantina]
MWRLHIHEVSRLGYKSVVHYLIQTRRSQIKSETSGAEVAEEGSFPSAKPSSHDESPETAKSLDNSTIHQPVDLKHDDMGEGYFTAEEEMGEVHFKGIKHVDVDDVGKLDAVAAGDTVDGEAKEKPRRRTRVSRSVILECDKGLYNLEANQVVQCVYQQDNLVMEEQTNPNMYQLLSFFSNQHDSPGHCQLLQEPLINGTYQEPV